MLYLQRHWRGALARLPLPMLALAASYGVYSYNTLFVPQWVALVGAAAFELTYVGLAVANVEHQQRRRAGIIAASAVAVSVLYNVASGLFHRRPDLLLETPLWADALLAVLHGLPLAIVAYNVAALLLHSQPMAEPIADEPQPAIALRPALAQAQSTAETVYESVNTELLPSNTSNTPANDYRCRHCGAAGLTKAEQLAHGRQRARHGVCEVEREAQIDGDGVITYVEP